MKSNIKINVLATAITLASVVFMPDAQACSALTLGSRARAPVFAPGLELALVPTASSVGPASEATVVGMWIVNLYAAPTGEQLDRGIQQFSSDGNEMINSSGSAPATDNSCFGVWQATGPGTFKVRHIGWNFDMSGTFLGVARLWSNITVDPGGDTYTGAFVFDSLDLSGNVIPESTIQGTLKAKRFKPI